jgi:hypothetical protein
MTMTAAASAESLTPTINQEIRVHAPLDTTMKLRKGIRCR